MTLKGFYETDLLDNMIHAIHSDPIPVSVQVCEEGKIHIYFNNSALPQIVLIQKADWVETRIYKVAGQKEEPVIVNIH